MRKQICFALKLKRAVGSLCTKGTKACERREHIKHPCAKIHHCVLQQRGIDILKRRADKIFTGYVVKQFSEFLIGNTGEPANRGFDLAAHREHNDHRLVVSGGDQFRALHAI